MGCVASRPVNASKDFDKRTKRPAQDGANPTEHDDNLSHKEDDPALESEASHPLATATDPEKHTRHQTLDIDSASESDDDYSQDVDDPTLWSEIFRPVTAAIDFGTTSSGFGFAFDGSLDDVKLNKWVQGSTDKDKTPTIVLLKKDKSFHSFGFDAESDYARLCDNNKQQGWRYFYHFKMAIYRNEKISRDMLIYDTEKKPMLALELLSIVIRHLKEEMLRVVRLQRRNVLDDDVMYIMTVPAIWSDAAKQLMREAATHENVGIQSDQLRLVLEPEAASVYCALRRTEKRTGSSDRHEFKALPEGFTYTIVDIGGGTLDIATHEVLPGDRLHEKHVARGNNMGGHYFNIKCLEFLTELFGKECFERWKMTYCDDFLNMERNIEEIKRKVSVRDDDVKLRIDSSLLELYQGDIESFGSMEEFSHAVKGSGKGCIVLKHEFLRNILKTIAEAIKNYLSEIVTEIPSIKTIFMVGGLAKSTFVRQYIETQFPQCRVIVPEDPGVAVLKGAVLLGNRPQTIASRVARYSYGVRVSDEFVEGKHREEHKSIQDGEVLCDNVFEKLIEKGQVLQYGQTFTTTTEYNAVLPESKQDTVTTPLYQSSQPSPVYVTDDGCCLLGCITQYPPEGGWPDYCELKIEIIVGEAEFRLVVSDDMGRKYESRIDFLLP